MSAPPAFTGGPHYVHATALLLGECGVLIRGPSGSGKSSLAAALIRRALLDGRFGRLVGDDRVALVACGGRLVARPHPIIAGMVERPLLGLRRVPFEPACVIRLVIDLKTGAMPQRLPEPHAVTPIADVVLPHLLLPARPGDTALPLILDCLDDLLSGSREL